MSGQLGKGRPTLSVVVPVYNVAGYLTACINSIADQSGHDLEIIAVDDGSTDDSSAILAQLAVAEPRLRIVTQANAGLGAARNAGAAHARGEFLWFVDSDDLLAPGAIDLMLGQIQATGSDFATGNVLRLQGRETSPARFLAPAFARSRARTHIHRFPPLIADRVAWNKVFRRSFWDRHDFRFPEGVHYEDQYVALPAHYLANAVDVLSQPVYLWRLRDDQPNASITQQRDDPRSMVDRVRAVEFVSSFLAGEHLVGDKRRYDESAVTNDLRLFLERFDRADSRYREEFLRAVKPYLDSVDPRTFRRLPVVRRLQWEAAQAGDADCLAELVRFEREELDSVRATHVGRRWYAEVPGRRDAATGTSVEQVQVRRELRLVSTVDDLEVEANAVRIRGRASVDLVGPVRRRLRLVAVPEGIGVPLVARCTSSSDGSFVAELPLSALRRVSPRGASKWRLIVGSNDRGLRRLAVWHERGPGLRPAARVTGTDGAGHRTETRIEVVGRGQLRVTVGERPPLVTAARVDDRGVLDVVGEVGDLGGAASDLLATGPADAAVAMPIHIDRAAGGAMFAGRLPLEPLLAYGSGNWSLALRTAGAVRNVALSVPSIDAAVAGTPVAIASGDDGYLVLTVL